jgi:DNA polymerase III epsilon subunit-like protein
MFCVVDLETTSSNVNNALILTGTFLAVDKDLNLVSENRIRCKPFKWDREADEASRIHRITRDMTQSWEPLSKQLPSLFSWIKEHNFKHFVCHAKRDMFGKKTTFDHAVIRLNLFPSEFYWQFVNTFNERNILSTHSLAMYLDKHYNFEKRDLKSICKTLGVTLTDHHDDRADAIACYEIFKILYPKVDLTDFVNWDFYKINADDSLIKRKTKTKR